MKRLHALFFLIFLSSISYAQTWVNVSNALQRKIVGVDTLYRFNMGAPGFWNISDKFGLYYTKVQSDARYALAGDAGVSSFNSRTGAVVPVVGDYSSFFPRLDGTNATGTWGISVTGNSGTVTNGVYTTGSYANPSWITSLAWGKITSTPTTLSGYGITDAVPSSRTISTTAPLTGGGDLSANRTFSIPAATGSVNGYLTSADWTTFNNKQDGFPGLQDSLTKKANRTFDNVAAGAIANAKLANSTISGISLGSNLASLSAGYGLSGSSYNGSTARTFNADSTVLANKTWVNGRLLSYAPVSGSGNYIHNQTASPQAEAFYMEGQSRLKNSGNTTALTIDNGGSQEGLIINNTGGGIGAYIENDLGIGMYLYNTNGANELLFLDNNSSSTALAIESNTGSGTGNGLTYAKNGVNVFIIDNDGDVTGKSFIKTGGTSSQFLKADGSTDGNTYLTTSSAASTYLPLTAGSGSPLSATLYSTATGEIILANSATTSGRWTLMSNNGGGFFAGIDNSTGSSFGGGNYAGNIYLSANAPLNFWTNSIKRYTIDGSGNNTWTGSGTFGGKTVTTVNNTDYTSELRNTHATGLGLLIAAGSASTDAIRVRDYTNGVENFTVKGNGTLTGTSATFSETVTLTSQTLGLSQINSAGAGANVHNKFSNAAGSLFYGLEGATGGELIPGTSAYSAVFGYNSNRSLHFATNNIVRQTINDAGNVGIGPTAPQSLLHISGGGTGTRGALRLSDGGDINYWEIGRDNNVSGDFTFNLNASEKMRITSGGNVGIGTTSPGRKLSLNSATTNTRMSWYESDVEKVFVETNSGAMQLGSMVGSTTLYSNNTVALTIASNQAATFASTLGINGGTDNVKGGTDSPTLTNVTNVTSSTLSGTTFKYTRVGNIVTVFGRVGVTPTTSTSTFTELGISLPVPSNLIAGSLWGVGSTDSDGSKLWTLTADPTNDRASLTFVSTSAGATSIFVSFSYEVL